MTATSTDRNETSRMDRRQLRRCLSRFPTGVTVVTYQTEAGPRGATVTSFTSVSLNPPTVLLALNRKAQVCAALDKTPFAINVLRSDQMDVALQFAGRPRPGLRIAWDLPADSDDADGEHPPSLSGAAAVLFCRPWRRYDGGDHVLQLGAVLSVEQRPGEPLAFGDGRFMTTGLPMFDGPMVFSFERPPSPGWVGAAHRLHSYLESA